MAIPPCPADRQSAAGPTTTSRRQLPTSHPLDANITDRQAYRSLLETLGSQPFGPAKPAGLGFDEVRRLLQPPLAMDPPRSLQLTEGDRRVLSELAFGDGPRRSALELETDLLTTLARLVLIDSQSGRDAGTRAVRLVMAERLAAIGFAIEHHREAGVTIARRAPQARRGARLLLLGHVDTVLPPSAFAPPLCRREGKLRGSGVGDMKGGLVVMLAALEALYRSDALEGRHLTVLLNSDEEIGSSRSRPFIAAEAALHDLGLCFESGKLAPTPGGGLTLARKGILGLDLTIWGESAHSGVAHHEGVDAGRVAARVIESLGWLNDYRKGRTANIGVLSTNDDAAGNRVVWRAELGGEIRYWDPAERSQLQRKVKLLVAGAMVCNPYVDRKHQRCSDHQLTMRGRPPSPATAARRAWFSTIAGLAQALGTPVAPVASGGASDMNLAVGLDMLDSFGPIGLATHTSVEHIPIDSLAARARLTALTIQRTAEPNPIAAP